MKIRKMLALLFMCAFAFSLIGCGNSSENNNNDTNDNQIMILIIKKYLKFLRVLKSKIFIQLPIMVK